MSLVFQQNPEPSTLPAVLPDSSGAIEPISGSAGGSPYVCFANAKSPNWSRILMSCRDVVEGDQVLVNPEPFPPVKVTPLKFHLVAAKQYWGKWDQQGKLLAATLTDPGRDGGYAEAFESILLVYTPDGIVPAKMSFKRAQCKAVKIAADAVKLAASAQWPKLSADHKATLAIGEPRLRFFATVRTAGGTVKSGPNAGNRYLSATSLIHPAGEAEMKACVAFFSGPDAKDNSAKLAAVQSSYGFRVSEIIALAAKS